MSSRTADVFDTIASTTLVTDDVLAWIDTFTEPTLALLELARHIGVAVNYQNRETLEGHLHRPLTAREWSQARREISENDYDERIDDTEYVDQTVDEFRREVLAKAGVATECHECGRAMFTADDGTTHHVAPGSEIMLGIDYEADARHVPFDLDIEA